MSFVRTCPLRFAHCDPAGIAYYPRYFEICDGAIEDWCAELLVPRQVMHLEMGLALPTVTIAAEFAAPSRLGDLLQVALDVSRVGTSSVDLEIAVTVEGASRFTVRYRQVLMEMATGRSTPWPDGWRARLEQEARP